MVNVSTRVYVQRGDDVLIGGLIITGDTPKRVVLRAIGPSLAGAGLRDVLRDPTMALHDSTGAVIAANDDWRSDMPTVQATGLAPSHDKESAIVIDLAPGAYTAVLSGTHGQTGIALFELYDVTPGSGRIANIATRGKVEDGDSVMIGGFIVGGSEPSDVVVRALGPSLTQWGIAGALDDPALELYDGNGALLSKNDDWRSNQEQQIAATSLAPQDDRESAIRATLLPGNYTAIVRSARASSTGIALIEVYNLSK